MACLDDPIEQLLALGRRHQLRVADAGNVAIGMQHDGRGDDRSGQAPAPHFVHPGDMAESHAAQRVLERAHGGDASHMGRKAGRAGRVPSFAAYWFLVPSFMRAALPFRSRR